MVLGGKLHGGDLPIGDFPVIGYERMVQRTQLHVPVQETPDAMASTAVALDVPVEGGEPRHQHDEAEEFQIPVPEDLF